MAKVNKYSVGDLRRQFPNDDACVDFLFDALHSRKCSCGGTYRKIKGRRQFQCSKCRFQIAPTAGTIFHKSDTPLTLWFHAIFVFSNAKSGVSAKELERQLGVTYKTAWRMLTLIRKALPQDKGFLSGDVEMDEAYFGGRKSGGKNNENLKEAMAAKSVVIGAVERKGLLKAQVIPASNSENIKKFLDENVNPITSRLMTDMSGRYNRIARGYFRYSVDHHQKEYVQGDVYTNTIESFWAHVKRSIDGTHKVISKKYLQSYVDGFVWHYNNRRNDRERFSSLLGAVLLGAK